MNLGSAPPDQLPGRSLAGLLLGSMVRHTLEELPPMMREASFTEIETRQTRFRIVRFVRGKRLRSEWLPSTNASRIHE